MKKSELRQLIRECINEVISESDVGMSDWTPTMSSVYNAIAHFAEYGQSAPLKAILSKVNKPSNEVKSALKKLNTRGEIVQVSDNVYEIA